MLPFINTLPDPNPQLLNSQQHLFKGSVHLQLLQSQLFETEAKIRKRTNQSVVLPPVLNLSRYKESLHSSEVHFLMGPKSETPLLCTGADTQGTMQPCTTRTCGCGEANPLPTTSAATPQGWALQYLLSQCQQLLFLKLC